MRCIVCPPRSDEDEGHEPDLEHGYLCCFRAYARMSGALGLIPTLCDELAGLGYVERDNGLRVRGEVLYPNTLKSDVAEQGRDPVANGFPAGPLNGSKSAPRVSGSTDAAVPIRIDPTDLLAPARPGSLPVAATGYYASDQVGYLSVATELEFWARDWADQRGERSPLPTVPVLAKWLRDRLDWACRHHYALDEFAHKLYSIRASLTAAAGRFDAPPQTLDRECPHCGTLTLWRDPQLDLIACLHCPLLLSDEQYAGYLQRLIEENAP